MRATHRGTAGGGHEHEFEAVHGLPEALPPGERMLWQGSPDWRVMARCVFHLRKLGVYFGALLLLRAALALSGGATLPETLGSSLGPLALALLGLGLVALLAWLSARSAVYTTTDKRIVMRIGIVLTLTFNIPFRRIAAAGLHLGQDGHGDIALALAGSDRIAWLHLWPHARPWRVGRPEPMLRNVPQAAEVSRLLAQAWSQATGLAAAAEPRIEATPARPGAPQAAVSGQPALAGQ